MLLKASLTLRGQEIGDGRKKKKENKVKQMNGR